MYKRIYLIIFIILLINSCSSKNPRIIVIGMDGITFDLVDVWIREGKLPNFNKIVQEGSSGRLISTIPFVSPAAWTSAVTGVNPGKHSIFSFVREVTFEKGEGIAHLNISEDRKAKAIWEIIGESGKRSLAINIPHTSPPEEINGILISGEPHADTDHPEETSENLTYPPEIKERFPNYRIDPSGIDYNSTMADKYLSDRFDITRRRERVLFKLMNEENWDLIWIVFTITDKVQHYYWKYMDSTHVLYNKESAIDFSNAILKVYQKMDSVIGKTLKYMDDYTTLLIMSDHGFTPIKKEINTENFLKSYLPDSIRQWIIAYDYVSPVFKIITPPGGGKKHYIRIRNALYNALKGLKDPSSGNKVNREVYFGEEIYHGPWVHIGPDVLAVEDNDYRYIGYKAIPEQGVFMSLDSNDFSAWHEREGLVIAYGKNIRNGIKFRDPSIMDITPTLLYLSNDVIPYDLDGRILEEGINRELIKNSPPVFGGYSVSYPKDRDAEKKLKSLDYL